MGTTTASTTERPARVRTTSPGGDRAPVRNEIRALTGLRAIAAGWVVVHHAWALTPSANWGAVQEPFRPLLATGWLGVDLFFVLSGFVLTHTYLHKLGSRPGLRPAASFYWNRLSRVWPTWAVVTFAFTGFLVVKHLTVGGSHLHEGAQPSLDPVTMVKNLLMVQVWDTPVPYATGPVGPGWSLSAEWLAYCVFPLVVLGLYRLRRCPAVVLGGGAVLAALPFAAGVVLNANHDFSWSWLVRIGGGFLAGAFTALCVARIRVTASTGRRASVVAGGAIVFALVVIWWGVLVGSRDGGDYAGLASLAFPVLVGALALADGGPARFLTKDWVVMGGRISFALYLVHECLFEVFWTAMDVVPALGPESRWQGLAAPLVVVATVPAAWLLWRFVEEPSRRAMRDLARRRERGAPGRVVAEVAAEVPAHDSAQTFVPSPALPPVPPRRRTEELAVR
jgi:peptidoglycan/LPS O-acetylase OafA/YrhL